MGRIDDLTDSLELKRAKEEAEDRLKEDFSEENFLKLMGVLLLIGDMRGMERYLHEWRRRKGKYPESFDEYLALFYMRTLKVKELLNLLPRLMYGVRALVYLKVLADPLKALELAEREENTVFRERVKYEIGTVMGIPYPLPEPRNPLEEASFLALSTIRDFHSGKIERALKRVSELVDTSVESWLRPTAIHIKSKELLVRGRLSDLYFLRLAVANLGLRREEERLKIYEGFLGRDVEHRLEGDRWLHLVLRLSEDAKGKMPLPSDDSPTFGEEAFWWYMSKIGRGEPYLSFSGRLRLMKGAVEVKLPRRKALVLLAFIRAKGYEFAKENAHIVFPESTKPKRRVAEYLRYIREYMRVPVDIRIAKRFNTFLDEEEGRWATFLREHVLNGLR